MSESGALHSPDIEIGTAAAIDAARQGLERGEAPIGAATVRAGQVISARHTEEVAQRRRLVHADLLALEDADQPRLSAADRLATTLVVTLEPCLLCMGAAMVFGVGCVHFALESPTDGGAKVAELWAQQIGPLDGFSLPQVSSGLGRSESLGLMREFVAGKSSGALWQWARDTLASIDDST